MPPQGHHADAIGYFAHGTTIGVNTLLERKGARLGMLVTKGFRDLLTIGRSRLPDIFDLRSSGRRRWCRAAWCG